MLNPKKGWKIWALTGFMLTDKKIHFSLIKRSYFASLFPFKEKPRSINLESIKSFQIGRHDTCYGTQYIGHDLVINNQPIGLVSLGFGFEYDDKALRYINDLSKFLYEEGFLKETPKEYRWQ